MQKLVTGLTVRDNDQIYEVLGDLFLTQLLVGRIGHPKKDRLAEEPVLDLILSPKTVPNMSTYRPDYPFQEQLGVQRSYRCKSY